MGLLETEKAYLAGLIDGEGCIYVDRYLEKRTGKYGYCLRMKIAMTCLKTLTSVRDTVSKFYKCNLHIGKGKKFDKWKQSYVFAFSTQDLSRFCEDILPYMVTKKERCKLAIEFSKSVFQNNRRGRSGAFLPLPDTLRKMKEEIYHKIRIFNKLGEDSGGNYSLEQPLA